MIGDLIGEWIKGILIDGIMGNLSGLFNTVNTKVGEIASDVGSTPQDWNGGIFSMLQNLSETVIVPIAAAILALVMCYELIDMIVEKNNIPFPRIPGMTAPQKNPFPTRGRSAGAFIPTRPTETNGKRSPDRIGKSLPTGKNWTDT